MCVRQTYPASTRRSLNWCMYVTLPLCVPSDELHVDRASYFGGECVPLAPRIPLAYTSSPPCINAHTGENGGGLMAARTSFVMHCARCSVPPVSTWYSCRSARHCARPRPSPAPPSCRDHRLRAHGADHAGLCARSLNPEEMFNGWIKGRVQTAVAEGRAHPADPVPAILAEVDAAANRLPQMCASWIDHRYGDSFV